MAQRILITNAWLKDIGGSELVAVELAEEYAARGWEAVLYSPIIGEPLLSSIDPKVIVTSKYPDLDAGWDIVWDQHGVLVNALDRRPGQVICTNHMSSYVEMEKPRYELKGSVVDRIFCNSEETRMSMGAEFALKAELMQNPSPFRTANVYRGTAALFISKHRPKELFEVVERLSIPSLMYNGDTRINRRVFTHASFLVANGKSVQYALTAGVPVFLYDHFGGPGWLTENNFEKAAYYNFSGRGFKKDKRVIETLYMYDAIEPIPSTLVNWRYRLQEWLYFKELI